MVRSERKPIVKAHMKYNDDLSYVHSMDLKKSLKLSTDTSQPLPLSYHDRTGHYLPDHESVMNQQVTKLNKFVKDMDLKINQEKSKLCYLTHLEHTIFSPKLALMA